MYTPLMLDHEIVDRSLLYPFGRLKMLLSSELIGCYNIKIDYRHADTIPQQ